MTKITDSELLLISKAPKERLQHFAEGVQFSSRSGKSIQQLKMQVASDRLSLARLLLKDANSAAKAELELSRTVVSRAYYAMYHATRAATYLYYGGDDNEQHSVLPTKMPPDFPNSDVWRTRLKDARLERNRADYDPYPKGEKDFLPIALQMIKQAKELIQVSQKYLRSKA